MPKGFQLRHTCAKPGSYHCDIRFQQWTIFLFSSIEAETSSANPNFRQHDQRSLLAGALIIRLECIAARHVPQHKPSSHGCTDTFSHWGRHRAHQHVQTSDLKLSRSNMYVEGMQQGLRTSIVLQHRHVTWSHTLRSAVGLGLTSLSHMFDKTTFAALRSEAQHPGNSCALFLHSDSREGGMEEQSRIPSPKAT